MVSSCVHWCTFRASEGGISSIILYFSVPGFSLDFGRVPGLNFLI
jgi:hypothetical protein